MGQEKRKKGNPCEREGRDLMRNGVSKDEKLLSPISHGFEDHHKRGTSAPWVLLSQQEGAGTRTGIRATGLALLRPGTGGAQPHLELCPGQREAARHPQAPPCWKEHH